MKNQKLLFFLTLTVYILIVIVLNFTIKKGEILAVINKTANLSDDQLIGAIVVGTVMTLGVLAVILVLIRILLQLVFKFIYKGSKERTFLNESYFVPLTFKFILLITAQLMLVFGVLSSKLWINIVVILLYTLYVLFFNNFEKMKKDKGVQIVTGILLILAI